MIHVRPLTATEFALGMRLKSDAGWNQTEADWQRARDLQPDGCFVAELDGTPVGTVTTCLFGSTGWIALLLVDRAVRGRGVGMALLLHALDFLETRGACRVRLDATPLGRPLYEKLGFVAEYGLSRYDGVPAPAPPAAGAVTAVLPDQFEEICRLDEVVTATDRRKLLLHLAAGPDKLRVALREGKVVGYCATRPGSIAHFIGPCIATADTGPLLLGNALTRHAGRRVFLDIPDDNTAAVALARARGLVVQRPLLRMCRGPGLEERIGDVWASSGPEKG